MLLTLPLELRPEHQRQPILHHDRTNAVPEQQARRIRQSHRGHRRGEEDRERADWTRREAEPGGADFAVR